MLPDRLQARIRAQLELPSPDLEARVLATELAELGNRARERLEQCAGLLRIGNEQAALEAAEAEPGLLDLCAWLGFADGDRWARLCRENGLPVPPTPDDGQLLAVELLYGKPIDESHPLYRDYRQAIRERDEARALAVLRTIVSANPGDTNACAELSRLGAKFARSSAAKVRELLAQGETSAAVVLMDRMERLGVNELAGDPEWEDSLRQRRAWSEALARQRLEELASEAARSYQEGDWEACVSAVGAARTVERNSGLRASGAAAAKLAEAGEWAGGRLAEFQAEAQASAEANALAAELAELRELAAVSPDALLLRRLRRWQERAKLAAGSCDPDSLDEAERLRRHVHRLLVRRHTLLTAVWLLLLLALLAAGDAALDSRRATEGRVQIASEAVMMARDGDLAGAERNLTSLGDPALLDGELRAQYDAARELIRGSAETERKLAAEAAFLKAAGEEGPTPATFADIRRRLLTFESELTKAGPRTTERLAPTAGDLAGLRARCERVARALAPEVRNLVSSLESAMGSGASLADPASVRRLLTEIRGLLDIPEVRSAVNPDLADRALARCDLAEARLRREQRLSEDNRRLDEAPDLAGYLVALRAVAASDTPTPESQSAAAVLAGADAIQGLPRSLLGPRFGAMWDALGVPPAGPADWTAAELDALTKVTDDRPLRSLRRFIIREHSGRGERVTGAVIVSGEVTRELRRFQSGTESIATTRVLDREGGLTEKKWSLRRFTDGPVSGEELTEGLPFPEQEYLRRFLRSFDPTTRRPGEPLLRTLERVRAESGNQILRAYHLQQLFAVASLRPAASNLSFSPSALSDASELRRITQNGLAASDFLFPDKWADIRTELDRFLARPPAPYTEEANFLRALLSASREAGLVFAGRVGPDGRALLREESRGILLFGIGSDGKPAALFQIDDEGKPRQLRDALPLSPLLRMALPLEEASRRAGNAPASLGRPQGGWDALLKGQDS